MALAPTDGRNIAYDGNSTLVTELAAARTALADDALAQREKMQALATETATQQASQRAELPPRAATLAHLGHWLREGQEGPVGRSIGEPPGSEYFD